MTQVFFIIGAVIVVFFLWAMSLYNRLVGLRNQVENSWAQIDVQLQRRYDLIPNLVEAVKGYMTHERSTLEAVVQMRNQAAATLQMIDKAGIPTGNMLKELVGAETALQGAMTKIFALSENYPELKANTNMQSLQEELTSTENKVSFARQSYNDQVLRYNNAQEVFPALLLATTFGHHVADSYEVLTPSARTAVNIKF